MHDVTLLRIRRAGFTGIISLTSLIFIGDGFPFPLRKLSASMLPDDTVDPKISSGSVFYKYIIDDKCLNKVDKYQL